MDLGIKDQVALVAAASKGLGKAIRELEDFECMYVDQGRHFTRCAPFPNMPGAAAEGA